MQILVDADACPQSVKEVIFKTATSLKIPTLLVANQYLPTPPPQWIRALQVNQGFDEADNEIVRLVNAMDLVITQDIPLAFEVIQKQALVLTPRGETLDKNNIEQRLGMRNFLQSMRDSGIQTGGPKKMNNTDKAAFSNAFDRIVSKYVRAKS